jgi:tetratricopeptide (TPR) repeat protein
LNRITKNILIFLSVSVLFICVSCSRSELSTQSRSNDNKQAASTFETSKKAQDNNNNTEQTTEPLPKDKEVQNAEEVQKAKDAQKKAELEKQLEDQYQEGYNAYVKKEYSTAIHIQTEIIKQDPNFYKAYTVKGIAQCFAGDFNSGMANIDKSLQLKPNYGFALFNKALAYELYRHFDDAITWYKKDLEVENYVWSYYGISSIYGRRGDVANTVKYLKLAIDIGPYAKTAAKTEKDFNNVRNSKEFQALISN